MSHSTPTPSPEEVFHLTHIPCPVIAILSRVFNVVHEKNVVAVSIFLIVVNTDEEPFILPATTSPYRTNSEIIEYFKVNVRIIRPVPEALHRSRVDTVALLPFRKAPEPTSV